MSELADVVRSSLTDEWRTTKEIVSGIPKSRGITDATHRMMVWRILRQMEREGLVEGGIRIGYRKEKEWRLRA